MDGNLYLTRLDKGSRLSEKIFITQCINHRTQPTFSGRKNVFHSFQDNRATNASPLHFHPTGKLALRTLLDHLYRI